MVAAAVAQAAKEDGLTQQAASDWFVVLVDGRILTTKEVCDDLVHVGPDIHTIGLALQERYAGSLGRAVE